jgi:hypothetical protein
MSRCRVHDGGCLQVAAQAVAARAKFRNLLAVGNYRRREAVNNAQGAGCVSFSSIAHPNPRITAASLYVLRLKSSLIGVLERLVGGASL